MTNFKDIYSKYFNEVFKFIFSMCHNKDIAEEITQETFFKALKNIKKFKGTCKLNVWLCQIAKNIYFTYNKKQKRLSSLENDIQDEKNCVENIFIEKERANNIHLLVHKLNEPYKEVFNLRVFGELSFIEIGELFNKTDGWARLIFYRAKKKIQEELE